MARGQITDMHIISDAGPIRGGIVCAEDVDVVEFTLGGHQCSGNDMGFRIVVFAAFAIGVCSRGIEVS